MEYRQHQLDNGLQILAECNPQSYTTAFGFFVKAGARDETPEIGGVSHFLEHMVFKGTPNRTAEQVNLQLDEMGSASNARTGEESTIYHATVLPEFQSEMVELLSDPNLSVVPRHKLFALGRFLFENLTSDRFALIESLIGQALVDLCIGSRP